MTRSGIPWLELALATQDPSRRKRLKKYTGNLSWDEIDFELAKRCLAAARCVLRWKAEAIEIDPRIIEILDPPKMSPDVAKAKLLDLVAGRLSQIQSAWAPSVDKGRAEIRFTAKDPDRAIEVNTWEVMIQFADARSAPGQRLLLCDHCGATFITEIKTGRYHSPGCAIMASTERRASELHTDTEPVGQTL